LIFGGAAAAAGLIAAVALATLVSDTGTADITVADKDHSAGPVTLSPSGASVEYIGSSASNQASGTGLFDPFVRLQGGPTEKGYNTNGAVQFDTKSGTWTHAIKVNAIPLVDCDGSGPGTATCWELFNDINESNTAKRVSLNVVEVWFTTNASLVGYVDPAGFPSGATKEYEFNGNILINDVNQGSGRGDLRMLIPTAGHTWNSSTYFVLYSKWGTTTGTAGNHGTGTYVADGGFEEWKVRKVPNLTITKTADAASVDAGTSIGFTITVTNSGVADATGVTISDGLPGGTGASPVTWAESPDNTNCSISGNAGSQSLSCGPVTIAAGGGSLSVHVSASTIADNCGLYDNTANFTSTNAGSGSATASITVNCGALVIQKESTKTGNPLVENDGAVFSVTGPNSYSASVTDNGTGDEDSTVGQVCISGLAPGDYTVNETTPPSGYGDASQTDVKVTVSNGTDCGSNKPTSAAVFTNAPLSDIQVNFHNQTSETSATISCKPDGGSDLTPTSTTPPTGWETSATHEDLPPAKYICTVVIDP
jgi:uncharacterized repeat protein (TIGR01451 family)